MATQTGTRSFFLSRLLDARVRLPDGSRGRLLEVWADLGETPRVERFTVATPQGLRDFLASEIELGKKPSGACWIAASVPASKAAPAHEDGDGFRLKKHLLDRQIVDLDGAKVVRVNDLRLALVSTGLFLVAVDVSFAAILRRLGLDALVRRLSRKGRMMASYIPWSEVQAFVPRGGSVRLATSAEKLRTLHPSELADIVENLDASAQVALLDALGNDSVADVIEELEPEAQVSVLSRMGVEKAADVLEQMDADEVADIMEDLPAVQAEELLQEMEGEVSAEVRGLMEYEDDQVGSLMSTEFVAFPEDTPASEVLSALRRDRPDAKNSLTVFAVDAKGRLAGTVLLPEVVVADAPVPLSELGMERPISVRDDAPIAEVVELLSKYRALSVPVVDEDEVLVGVVAIDDILADLVRAGGRALRG